MNIHARLRQIEDKIGLGSHQWPQVSDLIDRTAGRDMTPEEEAELSRILVLDPKLSAFLDSLAEAEAAG